MRIVVLLLFSFALLAGLSWVEGNAQIVPENHYLVYDVQQMNFFVGSMDLVDQFGTFTVDSLMMEKFATPVDKNGSGFYDQTCHLTWWTLFDPQSIWWTTINNQFGEQLWQVKDGRYLLLPALKNMPGPPPTANHYKCYDAIGPSVQIPVTLVDQFGTYSMVATEVVLFCNPVEKTLVTGQTYPIIEQFAHLACYKLEPVIPVTRTAIAYDQFGDWDLSIEKPCWLCLPTHKIDTVPNEPTTWGKIKALYEN
jgi:hypothetical protein